MPFSGILLWNWHIIHGSYWKFTEVWITEAESTEPEGAENKDKNEERLKCRRIILFTRAYDLQTIGI